MTEVTSLPWPRAGLGAAQSIRAETTRTRNANRSTDEITGFIGFLLCGAGGRYWRLQGDTASTSSTS